jgi:LAGLIDADG DNA endonuclease family protein
MISNVEAAYVAGIFDGEGSISLTRNRIDRFPSPQVSVTSTDRELLVWLRVRFHGSIVKKRRRLAIHSQAFEWKLTDRQALLFLQVIRPYLVIRRRIRRIELLLDAYLSCTPRNGRYSQEMLERKKAFVDLFASLP